jgi:hypothetical protein
MRRSLLRFSPLRPPLEFPAQLQLQMHHTKLTHAAACTTHLYTCIAKLSPSTHSQAQLHLIIAPVYMPQGVPKVAHEAQVAVVCPPHPQQQLQRHHTQLMSAPACHAHLCTCRSGSHRWHMKRRSLLCPPQLQLQRQHTKLASAAACPTLQPSHTTTAKHSYDQSPHLYTCRRGSHRWHMNRRSLLCPSVPLPPPPQLQRHRTFTTYHRTYTHAAAGPTGGT